MNGLMDRLMEAHRFWVMLKGDQVVDAQQMFPNCKTRYNKCCYEDRSFWEKFERREKELKPDKEVYVKLKPAGMFNSPVRYIWDGK